jgi:hypothetical protein
MANQVKQKLGFALLQDDEDEDDEEQQDGAVGETKEGASIEEHGGTSEEKAAESTVHEQEDEETFANACLLSDMHKIRQGIKKLWEASDTYILGLACSTSYRMKMAAAVIRSTVLCCPAISLTPMAKTCEPCADRCEDVKSCGQCGEVLVNQRPAMQSLQERVLLQP